MSFTIKQGRFEGPYNKLLELIENRKLSINEMSLSIITDEYVAYIKTIEDQTSFPSGGLVDNKNDISQFIVVAATLMLIKAKSLLPSMEYSREEAVEVANLEHKLALYKVLMYTSKAFKSAWSNIKVTSGKSRMKIDEIVFAPGNVKSITLQSVSILTIVKLPHLERLRQVAVAQTIKIEHVIDNILSHMRENHIINYNLNKIFNFKNIFTNLFQKHIDNKQALTTKGQNINLIKQNKEDRDIYQIVSFLAVLDMIRNGLIEVEQKETNGEISLGLVEKP